VRTVQRALVAIALVLSLARCGGGSPSTSAGKQAFASAGCGGCHTLAAAGATGTVGPNLDQLKPDTAVVVAQVEHGGNGMPAFRDRLTVAQIHAVGAYVAGAAAYSAVIPAAVFKPDRTTLQTCTGGFGFRCWEQAFGNVGYRQGPTLAFKLLEGQLPVESAVRADCHRITHAIGGGVLARFKGDVTQALVGGSTVCASGYYHGILERAFIGLRRAQLADRARSLCATVGIAARPFLAFQCLHGLGHGLMIYTAYDLPGSLATCDRLQTPFAESSCVGGAFMENFSSSYGIRSRFLRSNDLTYPCDAVAERDRYYCYIQVTERILPADGYNWPKTAAICRSTPTRWVGACFQSYGRDASGTAGRSAIKALSLCRIAGDREGDCIYGVARDIVNTDAGTTRGVAFCARAPEALRARCYTGVGTVVAAIRPSAAGRRAACRSIPASFVSDCLTGAGAVPSPPATDGPAHPGSPAGQFARP
jgi:hypothetical protein